MLLAAIFTFGDPVFVPTRRLLDGGGFLSCANSNSPVSEINNQDELNENEEKTTNTSDDRHR